MSHRPPIWQNPWLWFAVGLLLRIVYLWEQGTHSVLFFQPLLDEQEMVNAAHQLLDGHGFGPEPLFKAPLYPVILAAVMAVCGELWYWGIRLLQHLAGAALVFVAADATRCLLSPGRARGIAGTISAVVVATYAPLIRLESQVILDFFTVWFQSVMLWMMIRGACAAGRVRVKWFAAAGAMAALAWLNRPTITLVLPFLALWIAGFSLPRFSVASVKKRLVVAGVFLLAPLLAMASVMARNATAGGEAMLLPWQGGFSFYQGNKSGASGRYFMQDRVAASHTGNPAQQLAMDGYFRSNNPLKPGEPGFFRALDNYWFTLAKKDVAAAPGDWLGLMARKAVYLVSQEEVYNFEVYEIHKRESAVLRWLPFSFGWIWPLAIASLALTGVLPRGRRRLVAFVWLYAVLLAGAIGLYFASGRLRMPLMFPALLLGSAGIGTMIGSSRIHSAPARLAIVGALFIGGVAMSWGDWWGVRSEDLDYAEYARLSNAAYREGQYERALEYAASAAKSKEDYAPLPQLRGQALYAMKRFDEAAVEFEKSLIVLPGDAISAYNLGVISYYERHNPAAAQKYFEQALRRNPTHHRSAWLLALCRIAQGDTIGARTVMAGYQWHTMQQPPLDLLIASAALACSSTPAENVAPIVNAILETWGTAGLKQLQADMKLLGKEDCIAPALKSLEPVIGVKSRFGEEQKIPTH